MKTLAKTGLSMSQAQSISNICYQKTIEIDNQLSIINNYSKTISVEGESLIETQGNKIPKNIIELILLKGKYSATQAFLMSAIKEKDNLLTNLSNLYFDQNAFEKVYPAPIKPSITKPIMVDLVSEQYGWDQLTPFEFAEYLEVEAIASQIGKFIHKSGKLTELRQELPTVKTLEWIEIKVGTKTPLKVKLHHTAEQLLKVHEELATKHRELETRVNYFKAKVKNLTTLENARINRVNSENSAKYMSENKIILEQYNSEYSSWQELLQTKMYEFEEQRELSKKDIIALRINVDSRFQSTINEILKVVKE